MSFSPDINREYSREKDGLVVSQNRNNIASPARRDRTAERRTGIVGLDEFTIARPPISRQSAMYKSRGGPDPDAVCVCRVSVVCQREDRTEGEQRERCRDRDNGIETD